MHARKMLEFYSCNSGARFSKLDIHCPLFSTVEIATQRIVKCLINVNFIFNVWSNIFKGIPNIFSPCFLPDMFNIYSPSTKPNLNSFLSRKKNNIIISSCCHNISLCTKKKIIRERGLCLIYFRTEKN